MSAHCIGEPVSWLRLERRRLGELPAGEAERIDAHLAECDACGACAQATDEPVELPSLEGVRPLRRPKRRRWPRPLGAAAGAVAAAAALWLVLRPGLPEDRALPPARMHTKGGDVAVGLVRERDGDVAEDPERFAPGDRFKVCVTCPPGLSDRWQVLVLQGGEVFRPLPEAPWACGNRVPRPGAFGLTGAEPATVCVVWAEDVEAARRASGPEALGERAVCRQLDPAP